MWGRARPSPATRKRPGVETMRLVMPCHATPGSAPRKPRHWSRRPQRICLAGGLPQASGFASHKAARADPTARLPFSCLSTLLGVWWRLRLRRRLLYLILSTRTLQLPLPFFSSEILRTLAAPQPQSRAPLNACLRTSSAVARRRLVQSSGFGVGQVRCGV